MDAIVHNIHPFLGTLALKSHWINEPGLRHLYVSGSRATEVPCHVIDGSTGRSFADPMVVPDLSQGTTMGIEPQRCNNLQWETKSIILLHSWLIYKYMYQLYSKAVKNAMCHVQRTVYIH